MGTLVPPDPRESPQPPQATDPISEGTAKRPAHWFAEGVSGNPLGRPPGIVGKPTKELRAFCRRFVEDPEYRENLRQRIWAAKAPFLEALIWQYAYGKPPDKLIVEDQRPPFTIALRKMVEVTHEERTLAGPAGEGSEAAAAEAAPSEAKALPAPRRSRARDPEPPEGNGGGIIWGD